EIVNTENFKTKSRRTRRIPIAPELAAILRPYRAEWDATVAKIAEQANAGDEHAAAKLARIGKRCFLTRAGEPVSQNVGARLTKLGKRLKPEVYVTPHVLRKTFGTILLARDVPIERISAWLGHKDISTTQRWYARHTL